MPSREKSPRVSTSFTPGMVEQLNEWGALVGARNQAEALRLAVAYALANPPDRPLVMAYQQVLAELRGKAHEVFVRLLEEFTREVVDASSRKAPELPEATRQGRLPK